MLVLLDTNILCRLANAFDPDYPTAFAAIMELHRQNERLFVTGQNFVEFRNFATRPKSANGLGATTQEAAAIAEQFERNFSLLPETPDIFPAWKTLVSTVGVIGKQVHDARLVAVCHAHQIDQLLTFNVGHFTRLATFGPPLTILDPL